MKRKIRDTDIVYSAVSGDRLITRFALRPKLDGLMCGHTHPLRCRATYGVYALDTTHAMRASCRSVGCNWLAGAWVDGRIQRSWSLFDDGWLDWLAEGEGR